MDAFDADVLIFAAAPEHPLGRHVLDLFQPSRGRQVGTGSLLLLPEVLSEPRRLGRTSELQALTSLLTRIDLRPVDLAVAELATVLAAKYRLRASDATHLATAVNLGADRFITNNQRDFPRSIGEVQVTYPADLPDVQ
jgi:predicted nucleic acid-binding protein